MTRPRPIQREFEASVGRRLLEMVSKIGLKKSKLVGPKKVFLPKFGIHMNYYEREATAAIPTNNCNTNCTQEHRPTILFCHGIAGNARDFYLFIASMDIPPHVRILCPEQIGHGEDLKRAFLDPDNFKQPTHKSMLESTCEFLDVVKAGPNCNAFGVSMGGGLVYYLRLKRPDIIQRTVLVSPAIRFCLDDRFLNGILQGTNNFIDFQSRDDVKFLFRDMLSTGPYNHKSHEQGSSNKSATRKKKDPVPKFFLESIYRTSQTDIPKGHHREMLRSLLESSGIHINKNNDGDGDGDGDPSLFNARTDVDRDSLRLVIWPEDDQICNYEKAKLYFENSMVVVNNNNHKGEYCTRTANATEFETISDCGHIFHGDGRNIFDIIGPRVNGFLLDFSQSSSTAASTTT